MAIRWLLRRARDHSLIRKRFIFLAGPSALFFFAVITLWIRSYWTMDRAEWAAGHQERWIVSRQGTFQFVSLDHSDDPEDASSSGYAWYTFPADFDWIEQHLINSDAKHPFGCTYFKISSGIYGVGCGIIVPFWCFLLPILGLFLLAWRRPIFRPRSLDVCPTCSYDLRAHAPGDRCPECGTTIPAHRR